MPILFDRICHIVCSYWYWLVETTIDMSCSLPTSSTYTIVFSSILVFEKMVVMVSVIGNCVRKIITPIK